MQLEFEKLRGTETVLLVEDEDHLRGVVVDLLRELGYRVLEAASGADGLKLAQDNSAIDLLVTDVVMPGMTGPELMQKVRESRPNLKIIFISGFTGGKLAGLEGSAAEIVLVHKPFSIKTLTTKMRELLDA